MNINILVYGHFGQTWRQVMKYMASSEKTAEWGILRGVSSYNLRKDVFLM